MSVWAIIFTGMGIAGVVDDRHPGQWLPFWQKACAQNARHACENLSFLEEGFCLDGSGWACNESGILQLKLGQDRFAATSTLQRACELGFYVGCQNVPRVNLGGELQHAPPRIVDFPLILRGSKGPITERDPAALYALACEQGWPNTCNAVGSLKHDP
jgi:hypothetical protein